MQSRHETNEYILVAYPEKTVMEKIAAERGIFNDTYKVKPRATLKPHLVISNFFASEGMESTLIRWLQRICSMEQGFSVTLNNYSGYPTHTIFLRILDSAPIQNFVTQLNVMKDFIQPGATGLFRRPHIPIASKLPTGIYEQALSDYSRKLFHECFQINELVLLKRKDIFDSIKTVQVLGLLPAGNDLFNKVA
jgi:2'-5' RNA ligase superfamily protein